MRGRGRFTNRPYGVGSQIIHGRLKLDELITKVRPLQEANDAFADMEAGAVARTVLVP